jgi:hypothetical protein
VSLWAYALFEALLGSASISGAGEGLYRLYQLSGIEEFSVHSVLVFRSCVPFVVEQSSAVFGCVSFVALYLFARDADDTVFIDPS